MMFRDKMSSRCLCRLPPAGCGHIGMVIQETDGLINVAETPVVLYRIMEASAGVMMWPSMFCGVDEDEYPAYSIYSTFHERRSHTQDLPTTSHSPYHDKTAVSVRTHCSCWFIPRPLTVSYTHLTLPTILRV